MLFKEHLLLAFLALGMGAVLSRGSSLPVLKTPSTSVGFVSAPGVPLRRRGHMGNLLLGPRWNGVQFRGLSSRPVPRALCLAAVAARDGGDVNPVDKVAKAKARLVKAERELDAAQDADPVDDQRASKAELGVAMAELGVAKAELRVVKVEWKAAPESEKAKAELGVAKAEVGVVKADVSVAKAEVGVAKAEWQAAPGSEKAAFLANIAKAEVGVAKAYVSVAKAEVGVAKAEVGVAKAEWQAAPEIDKAVFLTSFETARKAYEKALNATTATPQQVMPQLWREAKPLVGTPGTKWQYQRSDGMVSNLREMLCLHWQSYSDGIIDKQRHPLFLVLSGAGTGKSRLLDEFRDLCVESVSGNNDALTEHLRQAYVFKISFENGREGDSFEDGKYSIGSRMLHQLSGDTWDKFRECGAARITPTEVLEHIAKIEGKSLPDMTFFLIVDGMQKLYDSDGDKKFREALQTVANLVNVGVCGESPLVIGCCSATFHDPIQRVLRGSPQLRIFLQPPSLDGHRIFKEQFGEQAPLVNLLIQDMGGHGRALEALWELLEQQGDSLDSQDLQSAMDQLRIKLSNRYPDWSATAFAADIKPLLRLALSRRTFPGGWQEILGSAGTIDDFTSLGLFSWNEESKTVDCPFILLWLLASRSDDAIIRQLVSGDYQEIQNDLMMGTGSRMKGWAPWEETVAKFRCLKSHAFHNESVPWSHLHAGAKMGSDVDQMVSVCGLEFIVATKQYTTGSRDMGAKESFAVKHQNGSAFIGEGRHLALNGYGARGGDSFCCFELSNGERVLEVQQAKFVQSNITPTKFEQERKKSCSDQDFFVLHSTGASSITKLAARSALVDASNIQAYYGVFAPRAVLARPDINTAPRSLLMRVRGIGPKRADYILTERQVKPFTSTDECAERTGIPTGIISCLRIGSGFSWNGKL